MAEEKNVAPDITKLKSAGTPQRGGFQNSSTKPAETPAASAAAAPDNGGAAPDDGAAAGAASTGAATGAAITDEMLTGLTDDQLKSVLKGKGINFENFDDLKNKLTTPAAPVELTPEQKAEQEKAFDKRMLDFHIANGGTAEDFVAIKQIAAMDLKTLSEAQIIRELKAEKFTDDEIKTVLKERYFQMNPDELTKDEEEAEEDFNKRKEFTKRKVGFGSKKYENHASYIKKDAEETLNELRQAIIDKDAADKKETEFSSKVDETSKNFPREITFELGEVNDQKIDPVKFKVSEDDITEVTKILKDKAQRETFLFNPDKTLNLSKVMEMMLENRYLKSAVKAGYIEGGNRQVDIFKKTFPSSPNGLGVGGSNQQANRGAQAGNLVKAGKPERVRPNN